MVSKPTSNLKSNIRRQLINAYSRTLDAPCQVLAASSLLSITHSLKLMLLLSDEQEIATRRAEELKSIGLQTAEAKRAAEAGWEALTENPS